MGLGWGGDFVTILGPGLKVYYESTLELSGDERRNLIGDTKKWEELDNPI